jgi:hypothetical protein
MEVEMQRTPRRRFWFEGAAAALATVLLVVTVISREWIEIVFRVDPDGGSGALEWTIVASLGVIAATGALVARAEWRRSPVPA